jgi:hypothetical protein
MSIKIERDSMKDVVRDAVLDHTAAKGGLVGSAASAIAEAAHGQLPGTTGKHPISAVVGTALTGGRKNAGTKGYLAVCHPALTLRCVHMCGDPRDQPARLANTLSPL